NPSRQVAYQTLGNLLINFPTSDEPVADYRRSLDIDQAVATTTYTRKGVIYKREVFASAPDQLIVVRLTADKPKSITCDVTLKSPHRSATLAARGMDELVLTGTGSNSGDIAGK